MTGRFTMAVREKSNEIRSFILKTADEHPRDVGIMAAEKFSISRQAVSRHINVLIGEGLIIAEGNTRKREYRLKKLVEVEVSIRLSPDTSEDRVWTEVVEPHLGELAKNVYTICIHGFTEIMNNAIEHSEGSVVVIAVEIDAVKITLQVFDDGIGIFRKISQELGLADDRYALLELAKGKFTTDPEHHSGEGIFFASRMFDEFFIKSRRRFYLHNAEKNDWLFNDLDKDTNGTLVSMTIDKESTRTTTEVFNRFTTEEDVNVFSRTSVPVALAQYGEENLVSRSQAKRLLARFDQFKKVILSFKGVDRIGQAFADEIFRVFKKEHPDLSLLYVEANDEVEKMIKRTLSQ
jgi:anti-sigma regulatory factor (Ser/Thr protein kinase)/biotin operon repressor